MYEADKDMLAKIACTAVFAYGAGPSTRDITHNPSLQPPHRAVSHSINALKL